MSKPSLHTWLPIAEQSDFSIHNLPFGIFSVEGKVRKVGVAIGDQIIDLSAVAEKGIFDDLCFDHHLLINDYLNDFIALGKPITRRVRQLLQQELCDENSVLKQCKGLLVDQQEAQLHLPVKVGDYTDFYSSIDHAIRVGSMFRDPSNALPPNWRHMPIAYHGRASSIAVSGQQIRRPYGQLNPDNRSPIHRPAEMLDYELEMALIIGKGTELGEVISWEKAEEHIFGLVIFNDWSVRDVQRWEYVPLGPFLSKNLASSISPWVVTLEALQDFRVAGPSQTPEVLPYLKTAGHRNFDIYLEVGITPQHSTETIVCNTNFKVMYWNMAQQIAHHTMNGCNLNVGDLLASGTISGPEKSACGCLLEQTAGGHEPVTLNNGIQRSFLEDGDTVTMRAMAQRDNQRIGFGEVTGTILPARLT